MTPERIAALDVALKDFFVHHKASAGLTIAQFCHDQAVEAGWWTDLKTGLRKERPWGEVIALAHSEISEALEGDRKKKMDDHLPQHPNAAVEIADLFIRLADTSMGWDLGEHTFAGIEDTLTSTAVAVANANLFSVYCAELHKALSRVYDAGNGPSPSYASWPLGLVFSMIVTGNEFFRLNLAQVVFDKLAYNRERADHKIENRVLENGKAY